MLLYEWKVMKSYEKFKFITISQMTFHVDAQ